MQKGITEEGKKYLARCIAENKPILFTQVKIGDGEIFELENFETFTEIKSFKKNAQILEVTKDNELSVIRVQFDNNDVNVGFFAREIGIYTQDDENEILFYYINSESESSWISPKENAPIKLKFNINLALSNSESTIINWTGKGLWVDIDLLERELSKKLNKGNVSSEYDSGEKIVAELLKKATVNQIGRVQIGKNLTIDEKGILNALDPYTHPTGNGNNHIPSGGATGQYLKYLSPGTAQWVGITWNDIGEKPQNFTPKEHTHNKSDINDFPESIKNPYNLKISLNGVSKIIYDGSQSKEINITPESIGTYTSEQLNDKFNQKSNSNHNHKGTYLEKSPVNTQFGNSQDGITTIQFLELLKSLGAFDKTYWCSRGTWYYAGNNYINDSGLGNIHLAGAVVEVFGGNKESCTIRITTPTTSSSGGENNEFIYVSNGSGYSPGWRKTWNSKNFNPDSKLNKVGGNMTGDILFDNNYGIGGSCGETDHWKIRGIGTDDGSLENRLELATYDNGNEKIICRQYDTSDRAVHTIELMDNNGNQRFNNVIANDIYLTSDKKAKTNLKIIDNPLEKIRKINGYLFNWIDSGKNSSGVIAQEVEKILPSIVYEGEKGKKVNYNGIIALLVETNKELIREIEILKGKVR